MYLIVSVLLLVLLITALADIITSDQSRIRHLDKWLWIIVVILLPLVGSILWFTVGHDYSPSLDRGSFGDPRRWEAPAPVPRGTEQELAALEQEIAADRIRQLEAELRAKRRAEGAGS